VYFDEAGDHPQAALWQARAAESARQSGYIWEFGVYTARALRLTLALLAAVIVYGVILQGRYAPARRLLRQPGFRNWLRRRDPRWSLSFWSRRDRLAMTLLVLFLWLTFGVFGTFGESGARMESAPQSFGAGSLRATDARSFLESLAESPDRNFLLALSLHQQGEHAAAEPLYRAVSHSAEAWNNLGVLLADQGRAQESADSFRKALEIDPEMKEAAFNLGQPATGYWVDLHRERLPGQKMLATPSHDMVYRAMRGPLPQFAGHILMGPFSAARALKTIQYWSYEASNQDAPLPLRIVTGIRILWTLGLCLVFGGLLLLLYVAPYREVLRTPSRWHRFLQLAGPGASPRWQALGGIVLGLFVYFIFESAFQDYFAWFNWPLASGRAFGLPTTLKAAFQNAWPPAASTTTWSIASAALLFAVNAVMVLHEFGTRKKI
jgi:tetratricopeptide (TPR) repeat protein